MRTVIRTPLELRHAIDARRRQLGLRMNDLDLASGCQDGYVAKLLGPAQVKRFGEMSLKSVLGALGMRLLLSRSTEPHLAEEGQPLGDLALSAILDTLGLRLTLIADDALVPAITKRLGGPRASCSRPTPAPRHPWPVEGAAQEEAA